MRPTVRQQVLPLVRSVEVWEGYVVAVAGRVVDIIQLSAVSGGGNYGQRNHCRALFNFKLIIHAKSK
jgi:hypothetical protein